MTESKRATWADFLRWVVAERAGDCPGPTHGLRAAADYVRTERDAAAALMGRGVRTVFIDGIIDDWRDVLEGQGISPPVEPPSVAEVLESVATSLDERSKKARAEAAACVQDDALVSHDPVLFGWSCAYACAAEVVRAKAKELA